MSQENLNNFLAKVQSDSGLQDQLKAATDAKAAVAIAASAGFNIKEGDLLRRQARLTSELSDEELENVSGGISPTFWVVLNVAEPIYQLGNKIYTLATETDEEAKARHAASPFAKMPGQ